MIEIDEYLEMLTILNKDKYIEWIDEHLTDRNIENPTLENSRNNIDPAYFTCWASKQGDRINDLKETSEDALAKGLCEASIIVWHLRESKNILLENPAFY